MNRSDSTETPYTEPAPTALQATAAEPEATAAGATAGGSASAEGPLRWGTAEKNWSGTKTLLAAGVTLSLAMSGGVAAMAATHQSTTSATQQGMGGPGGGAGQGGAGMSSPANLGTSAVHSESVVKNGNSWVTQATQTGTVTAISSSSITVKSADGFIRTYAISSSTALTKADAASRAQNSAPQGGGSQGSGTQSSGTQGSAAQGTGSQPGGTPPSPPSASGTGNGSAPAGQAPAGGTGSTSASASQGAAGQGGAGQGGAGQQGAAAGTSIKASDIKVGVTVMVTASKSGTVYTAISVTVPAASGTSTGADSSGSAG